MIKKRWESPALNGIGERIVGFRKVMGCHQTCCHISAHGVRTAIKKYIRIRSRTASIRSGTKKRQQNITVLIMIILLLRNRFFRNVQ